MSVAEQANLDFSLELPIVTESVTVNSQAALLNSTDPAVSTIIDPQLVQNMPLNGRTFQPLIALTPGVNFIPVGTSLSGLLPDSSV
ncbi:MAG: hypothetical protein JO033_03120 [Acidobacteriaceae bacterium]|nr:hypothetical protein [Acidobacteriota bacterium]MBV8807642.1 hypothetical protein [Acidobacteriaceae bacterium]MBV9502395.1 hypothetical protein [Acidobacteriaceae bacterium]